ncbi:6-phosphogluconolactonase [Porticoccus sp. W117]|uniref:6-phosphogluconolactonase n=1 Tax=Porticoccus sp. W117 TaxID=3054777 RepID=UPI002593B72B|nr:6-phosphogluconolactonase [Porticoccus sp. W117]MDM3870045.1 6-phosphogluconolactonase [Porticoccus sp. W117]
MVNGIRKVLTDTVSIASYSSSDQLAEQLAATVARELRDAVTERGVATLAVSGGSTPKAFFQALSRRELPWQHVIVTLVDERWVDADHPASNARLVAEQLLQNRAHKARFMPLKNSSETPFDGVNEVEQSLQELPLPFDVVVLGMGDDGHTASFFPQADNLEEVLDMEGERLCLPTTPPVAPHDRMTLSLPAVLNCRFLALHFEGSNKWRVFQKALGMASQASYPVSAVLRQNKVPVNLFYTGES